MAGLRHRSCSAARSCPPPLARPLPRPTLSSCWSLLVPSELNGNKPRGSSRAFGLCARALESGCIRGRRMHLFDDGSSYGCTRRTEAAHAVKSVIVPRPCYAHRPRRALVEIRDGLLRALVDVSPSTGPHYFLCGLQREIPHIRGATDAVLSRATARRRPCSESNCTNHRLHT